MKCMVMKRMSVLVSAAVAACVLLPVFPVDALAQEFVTGSANTDGFSIVGWLRDIGNGLGRGAFTIIVHRDSVDGTTVAVVCNYKRFNDVVISVERDGNTAKFHSVGSAWPSPTSARPSRSRRTTPSPSWTRASLARGSTASTSTSRAERALRFRAALWWMGTSS